MTKTKIDKDEFDEKAKEIINDENKASINDLLREYAQCVSYEQGKEIRNPGNVLKETGIETMEIDDFTEYRVAKSMIKEHITKQKQ